MQVNVRILAGVAVVLAMAVCLLGTGGVGIADEKSAEDAQKATLKLAESLEKGDKDAIAKDKAALMEMDLLDIMTGFKKRDAATPPVGIGIGPKKGVYNPDGIEAQLLGLAKKELTADALKKQGEDLAKAAYVTLAIAEVTGAKCTVKTKMGDKDPKDWAKFTEDMKKAAQAMADAAKKGDTKALKDAAGKLNASCNDCHVPFRDS